jgi:heme/copper-type cytochrome/quinol oxidase subunit 4
MQTQATVAVAIAVVGFLICLVNGLLMLRKGKTGAAVFSIVLPLVILAVIIAGSCDYAGNPPVIQTFSH